MALFYVKFFLKTVLQGLDKKLQKKHFYYTSLFTLSGLHPGIMTFSEI